MSELRILLDMDEVLCDFVTGAVRAWGYTPEEVYPVWDHKHWHVRNPLSILTGKNLSEEDFWRPIDALEFDFWGRLDPCRWTPELIKMVESLTGDWHVVSSPHYSLDCYTGKVVWLKNYFGPRFDRFALTPHKEIFAGPNVVLIDDSDANVRRFRAAGGKAILFPRHWNSMHSEKADPMRYTRQALAACRSEM